MIRSRPPWSPDRRRPHAAPRLTAAALLRVIAVALVPLLGVLACGGVPAPAPRELWERTLVDLTHPFDADTITWPTERGFELTTRASGWTEGGYYYEAHAFTGPEHGGTHLDAPIHFHEAGATTDRVPLERLIGPAVVVDARAACAADRDHLVGLAELEAWERRHGRMPEGAIVLLHTGFGRYWPDRERYLGTAARGAEGVAALHFPGLDPAAVPWLADRRIAAIGLDTASIDHGPSKDFAAHVALAARGIPIFENVARLDRLPPRGATLIALPMKIGGGSGGPLRIVAALP